LVALVIEFLSLFPPHPAPTPLLKPITEQFLPFSIFAFTSFQAFVFLFLRMFKFETTLFFTQVKLHLLAVYLFQKIIFGINCFKYQLTPFLFHSWTFCASLPISIINKLNLNFILFQIKILMKYKFVQYFVLISGFGLSKRIY